MDEYILVICEEIPETTTLYLMEATQENIIMATKVDGKFINSDDLTEDQEEFIDEILNHELPTVPTGAILNKRNILMIINTGIVL